MTRHPDCFTVDDSGYLFLVFDQLPEEIQENKLESSEELVSSDSERIVLSAHPHPTCHPS